MIHKPVMPEEVMEFLSLEPKDVVVDCTVGAGGHSLQILKKIIPGGKLIGIDQDEEILEIARRNMKKYNKDCELIYGNFRDIGRILSDININKVDAFLYDLGISSYQLTQEERGFSFLKEGPLDMRMDIHSKISAFDLVNNLSKEEIIKILLQYGQERYAKNIASFIVKRRKNKTISTTKQLADIVKGVIPSRRRQRINPATRTFLAFRIAVNNELESLETSLNEAIKFLNPGGKICVISFHSLEDRIVKNKFKELAKDRIFKILTRKPVRPKRIEVEDNPRSRSAKLRVAIKVG